MHKCNKMVAMKSLPRPHNSQVNKTTTSKDTACVTHPLPQ
jgi:hypothetical protein